METNDNNPNERAAPESARPMHLTVETANTTLRLTIDRDTARLSSRELLTVEGAPPPFVVIRNGTILYVSIPVESGGSVRVTLSANISQPLSPGVVHRELSCVAEEKPRVDTSPITS